MRKIKCLKDVEANLKKVLADSNKNILELQHELSNFWSFDVDFINTIKEKYHFDDDVSVWQIYSFMGRKLRNDTLIYKDAEIMLDCLKSSFKKPISSVAFLMLNVLIVVSNDELNFVQDIFKKLLLAPKCAGGFKGAMKELDDLSELDNYERDIRECLLNEDQIGFRKLSKEYFVEYFKIETVKKIIQNNGFKVDEMMAIVDGIFLENQKRIVIPKDIYDKIKEYLNIFKSNDEKSLTLLLDILGNIESVYFLNNDAYKMVLYSLQNMGLLNKNVNYTFDEVKLKLSMTIESIRFDLKLIQDFKNSLSLEGLKKSFPGLPRLIMSLTIHSNDKKEDLYLGYLFMTGIKINGTSKGIFQSENYPLEIEMARLIQDDYTIKEEDKMQFKELFRKYIFYYASSLEVNVSGHYGALNDLINDAVNLMGTYIDKWPKFRASMDNRKKDISVNNNVNMQVSRVVNENGPKKVNPLDEFIQKGKVVKITSLDNFAGLLQEANIPNNLQEEYMKQMVNLQNRMEKEKYLRRVEELREEVFTEEEIEIINKAKISGNMEATQVVKDIEAIFDLLLEVNDDEEKKELLVEIKHLLTILNEILNPVVNVVNDWDVAYFKKDVNGEVPKLYMDLKKLKKSECKLVGMELNKILQGNTKGDKEVLGISSPVRIMFKGKTVRVFYAMIGDIKVILGCGLGDKAFQEIKSFVNSKDFLLYLKDLQLQIKNGDFRNENDWTSEILGKLGSSPSR